MLGMKHYPQDYIDACRARVDTDLRAYGKLTAAAKKASDGDSSSLHAALRGFEPRFFNNMVLVLDELFVHRLRTVEGKDGNPLNEVRVLANSIILNGGTFEPDNAIKLAPETSVLKHRPGDKVALTESDFEALSKAYFDEVERKFA